MFMTPRFFLPFQKKITIATNVTNVTTTTSQNNPTLTPCDDYKVTQKRINCDDALTMFKIWATIFVFTFPITSFPYHKKN